MLGGKNKDNGLQTVLSSIDETITNGYNSQWQVNEL